MTIAASNIRLAIREVLQGDTGSIRTMTPGVLAPGVWEGQTDQQQKATILDTAGGLYHFDVRLGPLGHHPATPLSIKGNTRISQLGITIDFWGPLATEAEADQRQTDLAVFENALDDAVQALTYPGNLTQTSSAAATGIVSGCLVGFDGSSIPEIDQADEDWGRKIVHSQLRATAILTISQATS